MTFLALGKGLTQTPVTSVTYYWDSTNLLTLPEILANPDRYSFTELSSNQASFPTHPHTLWLSVALPAQPYRDANCLLINNPILYRATCYISSGRQIWKTLPAGVGNRDQLHMPHSRLLAFDLTLDHAPPADQPIQYWLKIVDDEELRFPLELWDKDSLIKKEDQGLMWVGLLLGLLAVATVCYVVLHLIRQDQVSLYTAIYISILFLNILNMTGFPGLWVPSVITGIGGLDQTFISLLAGVFFILTLMGFIKPELVHRNTLRWLGWLIVSIMLILSALHLPLIFLSDPIVRQMAGWLGRLGRTSYIIGFVYCIIPLYYMFKHRRPGSRFFILGLICLSTVAVIHVGLLFTGINIEMAFPRASIYIGVGGFTICLLIGAAESFIVLAREREQALANELLASENVAHLNQQLQLANQNLEDRIRIRTTELATAKEAAEAAARAKANFLATMSHEIRTPMHGIIAMANLITPASLPEDERGHLQIIRNSGETLLTIINDILDFSKIESGKLDLEHAPFDLSSCIKEVISLFGPKVQEKQLDLRYVIDTDVPIWVLGDQVRLKQILFNLISNAVKFTQEGTVTTFVSRSANPLSNHMLQITVADTGIGIPSHKLDSLFQAFHQIDASVTRQFGGTGLGLAISKRLVNLMRGEITVQSTSGKGSRFTFTAHLPATTPHISSTHSSPLVLPSPAVQTKRVLLVEDNRINQRIAQLMFGKLGQEIVIAGDGQQALLLLKEQSFDLVFMDIQMPVLDGLSATQEIRKSIPAADLPIIAMTANAMPEDREACLASGMDDYLTKPLKIEDLKVMMNRWGNRNPKTDPLMQ